MKRAWLCVLLSSFAALACTAACRSGSAAEKAERTEQASEDAPEPSQAPSTPARPRERSATDESVDGYRVIRARTASGQMTTLSMKAPKGWEVMAAPNKPDPHAGKFTLDEALKGLPKQGTLAAQIKTSMGSFYCDLYPDKAPNTVANFVGLARGLRQFWDAKKLEWTARKYYDGTAFHRVIPGFMIQGGDHTGTGQGRIGYMIPDESAPDLHHDRPGQLCMANRGPNTSDAQFFITEGPAPHLKGSYTIFGQCEPATLVQRIARVPQDGAPNNRPLSTVAIEKVEIRRLAGGAAKWMPASAKLPPLPGLPPPGRAVQVQEK
jgi:peptidyl-prolyl cis-trans isomerase A (cyclophilin A)